jgi:hypothetical protein
VQEAEEGPNFTLEDQRCTLATRFGKTIIRSFLSLLEAVVVQESTPSYARLCGA